MNFGKRSLGLKKGFSLIEIGVVLFIIGVMSYVVFSVFGTNNADATAKSEGTNFSSLATSVKSIYSTPNYTGLNIADMITGGQVPKGMVDGNQAFNANKGLVTVGPTATVQGANRGFYIASDSVPTSVCTKLVNNVARSFKLVTVVPSVAGAPATAAAAPAATIIFSDGSLNGTAIAFQGTLAQTACGQAANVGIVMYTN